MKYPECPVCGVSRQALEEEMAQPPGSDARCQAECIITSCHCCLTWWIEYERLAVLMEQEQAYRRAMFYDSAKGGRV